MSRRRRPSRRSKRSSTALPVWAKAVGGIIIAAAILFVAEGVARVAGPQIPEWQGDDQGSVVMGGHPTRLWGMNTGIRQVGSVRAFINDGGLRGQPPELPRPEGRQRIMLVGDSTYFGHGILDDETIIARTVALFQADGLDVDAINGGIPGYSTEQTRLLMEEDGWALEPTLLLIGNLWSDNNFDHFRDADLLRTRKLWMENPLSRSALFLVVASVIDGITGDPQARVVTWMRSSELPEHGIRRVPLPRYAHNLDVLVREAKARGIQAGIVTPVNRQMAEKLVAPDLAWKPYFDAQEAVAAHHGIPRIQLAPALVEAAKEHGAANLYLDEMHPTALGATYFAQALHDGLVDWGWPDKPSFASDEPFDTSTQQDVIKDGTSLTVNELSPQANLYPSMVRLTHQAPDDQTRSYEPSYWSVSGKVTGADGPVLISVQTAKGEEISAAELTETHEFSVTVSNSIRLTQVVAKQGDGRTVSVECAHGCEPVTLSFD